MSGWTKLFSSIVTSSIWIEDDATLRVWIAMLAMADAEGLVEGSIPGFASMARVSTEQMRAAIATLSSPDPDSRTPDHEGRRIETIEGGWRILNYHAYRERPQTKDGSKAPAMRAYRARQRALQGNQLQAEPPTQSPPHQEGADIHVEQAVADRAGAFLDRYAALYAKARHGAFYRLKPARDHAYACQLVATWPDDAHLDKMAELFLLKSDWKPKNEPGTVGQFLHMAPQADAELRKHGHAPTTPARRTA
jgi:hypothetical protein